MPQDAVRPSAPKTIFPVWLSDGLVLTVANFVAALGSYFFQALMRRHLSWPEFGYLNTTLSLILFAGVPLTAASQTMAHHLAHMGAMGRSENVAQLQAAGLKLLRHLTWIVFGLCVLLLPPLAAYLRFPRASLAWAGLLWIPVNLWSTLGSSWCAGLSRFRLLSVLIIGAALLRLVAGAIAVSLYPWAEAGIAATIISGVVLGSIAVFSPHHATASSLRQLLLQRDWLLYGLAALAVAFGSLAFFQGDQILAQRHFPGGQLGRYTGVGLLGRTIVWASAPILTVYFTRRSGHHAALASPTPLLGIYLGLLAAGAIGIVLLRDLLLQLLLGVQDADLSTMTARFALAMIPIGILQAMGCHSLATRRLPECLAFAACAVGYLVALSMFGHTPASMLNVMSSGATVSVVLLVLVSVACRRRNRAPLIP
jgi:O-antigen/teichoic acid export membrane protein